MSSTLVKTLTRTAPRTGTTRVSRIQHRHATSGPPMSQGGGMRPIIIGALASLPILAYFVIPLRTVEEMVPEIDTKRPNLDPGGKKRRQKEEGTAPSIGGTKYMHPEHKDPEAFKPGFGIPHKRKRVDEIPDGRHHQTLNDRARRE
ncbi:hypothetical protein GGS21DRAFT_81234 [Xylaria nigripes]|nr:hypothetical protein GGS21DRAFT_81234 [Xylaria nigripes]